MSRTDRGRGWGRLAQCLAFEARLAGAGLSSCFRKKLLVPQAQAAVTGPFPASVSLLARCSAGALCREVLEKPLGCVM